MQYFAIIVAGGTGQRMNSSMPKQFLLLDGIPVLMRTIHAFHRSQMHPQIVVVLAPELQEQWTDLCYNHRFHVPHLIADGGATRFQSVRNGLDVIAQTVFSDGNNSPEQAIIAVHDGARPLVRAELIDRGFTEAGRTGAVVPAVLSTDSLRLVEESSNSGTNKSLPRDRVYRIQTPQIFRASILFNAYRQAEADVFTDDATVVENMGIPITMMDGDPQNIKITHRHDLWAVNAWLQGE